jgi:intein/homing endonuclease
MEVKKIRTIRNEDVYDITVNDNQNFMANGMLVHNCGKFCHLLK